MLNGIPLSRLLLLDITALFLTLGVEYNLKRTIYEDWKDVRKEFIINKIKLGPSMNIVIRQQWINYGDKYLGRVCVRSLPTKKWTAFLEQTLSNFIEKSS